MAFIPITLDRTLAVSCNNRPTPHFPLHIMQQKLMVQELQLTWPRKHNRKEAQTRKATGPSLEINPFSKLNRNDTYLSKSFKSN